MPDDSGAGLAPIPGPSHGGACVLDLARCHLGEGPSYDIATDTAWWIDILEPCLFERRLSEAASARMYPLSFAASDVARIDACRHLLSGDDGLYVRMIADGRLARLCALEDDDAGTRSNDGRVHPSGALWISTMGRDAEPGRGTIYHVAGTRVTRLFGGLAVPNGIAFSPDGTTGYFVDTEEGVLRRATLDAATGLPAGDPVPLHVHAGPGGIDGAAVDAEGLIWTAHFGAGRLVAYAPDGERAREIAVPVRQPTCPTFAGRGLDHLLVTSAYEGMDEEARAGDPEHGRTLLVAVGTRGLLEPSFRLGD